MRKSGKGELWKLCHTLKICLPSKIGCVTSASWSPLILLSPWYSYILSIHSPITVYIPTYFGFIYQVLHYVNTFSAGGLVLMFSSIQSGLGRHQYNYVGTQWEENLETAKISPSYISMHPQENEWFQSSLIPSLLLPVKPSGWPWNSYNSLRTLSLTCLQGGY